MSVENLVVFCGGCVIIKSTTNQTIRGHMHVITPSSERGFAHLGIILAVAGVVVIGGLVAWRFLGADKAVETATSSLAQKLASAKCDYDDKDLCKFFVSWKEHDSYTMVSTGTDKVTGDKSTLTFEVDGKNTRHTTTGQYAMDTITIGEKTMYLKAANGVWWKQNLKEPEGPNGSDTTPAMDFEEPATGKSEDVATTSYKLLGKEACGKLTCFKYQVLAPGGVDSTEYIWFDTKDYQLRRSLSDSPDMTNETTFSYDHVTVKAPSSFKELGPNQMLMPGESEPTTLPSAADYGN
jgi:outer membrane lipoprotein-sorting protein